MNFRGRDVPPWRSFQPLLALLLLLASAAGCTREEEAAGHTFRVEEDPDGNPMAVNSKVPRFAPPVAEFRREVVLHQDETRPESLLNMASQFLRGPDGDFYVADSGNSRIAVFGSDGEFERAFGRSGTGPGEFSSPMLQSVTEEGVVVYGWSSRRLQLFGLDGSLQRTFSRGQSIRMTRMWLDGDRIVSYQKVGGMLGQTGAVSRQRYTMVNLAGDTLATIESGDKREPTLVPIPGGGIATARLMYDTEGAVSYRPGQGFVVWDTGSTELRRFDRDGQFVRRIRLDLEREPVTQADREGVLADLRRIMEEAESEQTRAYWNAEMEYRTFADTKPYFESVTLDDRGYVWVHRWQDEADAAGSGGDPVMLLSPEGEYLGDAVLPAGAGDICGGYVYVISEDEETGGYEYSAYRIESAVPGFVYPLRSLPR